MKLLNEQEINDLAWKITKSVVNLTIDETTPCFSITQEIILCSLLQPGVAKLIRDALTN